MGPRPRALAQACEGSTTVQQVLTESCDVSSTGISARARPNPTPKSFVSKGREEKEGDGIGPGVLWIGVGERFLEGAC